MSNAISILTQCSDLKYKKNTKVTQKGGEFREKLSFDKNSQSTLCVCSRLQVKRQERQELRTFLPLNPRVLHFKISPESASESTECILCQAHRVC